MNDKKRAGIGAAVKIAHTSILAFCREYGLRQPDVANWLAGRVDRVGRESRKRIEESFIREGLLPDRAAERRARRIARNLRIYREFHSKTHAKQKVPN